MAFLKSFRGYSSKETSSIFNVPLEMSVILRRVLIIVVFPAPVLPTIPIFYPGTIWQET